jgi:hypothetical protein
MIDYRSPSLPPGVALYCLVAGPLLPPPAIPFACRLRNLKISRIWRAVVDDESTCPFAADLWEIEQRIRDDHGDLRLH